MKIQNLIENLSRYSSVMASAEGYASPEVAFLLESMNSDVLKENISKKIRLSLLHAFLHYLNDNRPNGSCCAIMTHWSEKATRLATSNTRPTIQKLVLNLDAADKHDEMIASFFLKVKKYHVVGIFCDLITDGNLSNEFLFYKFLEMAKSTLPQNAITVLKISSVSELPLQNDELNLAQVGPVQHWSFLEENFEENFEVSFIP